MVVYIVAVERLIAVVVMYCLLCSLVCTRLHFKAYSLLFTLLLCLDIFLYCTHSNSKDLVECGFDGDMDGILSWVEKGYHIESTDGRKHTALSEAACNGHIDVVQFLIEQGADPNAKNDTGRTPLVGGIR